jgi:putative transposase
VVESWHSTLEFELRSLEHFTTKAQARARAAAWINDLQPGPRSPR